MNCPNCSQVLPAEARFCSKCGKNISLQQAPPQAQPQFEPVASPTPSPTSLGKDTMKGWWIAFGIILFVLLFIPKGIEFVGPMGAPPTAKIMMFWDIFNVDARGGAWFIVNAVVGIAMFIIALIFGAGIVRGSVMGGAGFIVFIIFLALVMGPRAGIGGVFLILAHMSLAVMLGGCLLRKHFQSSLTAAITSGVSGGLAIVFFLVFKTLLW